jgi:selenide,water dikinase
MNKITLTNLSQAGGCGCKQNQELLSEILCTLKQDYKDPAIIVDFTSSDDCAVYDLNKEEYLLFTTDFFTPVVDDPYIYGVVSAANALSDIYAMGGKPLIANTILGYPRDKLTSKDLERILRGGTETLNKADCRIVGGHTIENTQPFYGFTILGTVKKTNLKKNIGAQEGDILILTKPLGIGIYSNALKLGLLADDLYEAMLPHITKVNSEGFLLGSIQGVHSLTDLTGFGLIGHALELCQNENLSLELFFHKIDLLPNLKELVAAVTSPNSGLMKNFQNYKEKVDIRTLNKHEDIDGILPLFDPQSNGGLLVAVSESDLNSAMKVLGPTAKVIGRFVTRNHQKAPITITRQ